MASHTRGDGKGCVGHVAYHITIELLGAHTSEHSMGQCVVFRILGVPCQTKMDRLL